LNAALPPASLGSVTEVDEALLTAFRRILAPLARLAIARGVRHAQLDELLRSVFVDAARDAHPDVPANRSVSRVSAATGLHRREVARLMGAAAPEAPRGSLATQLFTRWLSHPAFRKKGAPLRSLPRQGAAPSFESLAQSVTKDVHPRTLLEEVCRLGLATHDEKKDTVTLVRDRFVPDTDERRMLGFLGHNVGDHLAATVANVLNEGTRQLEQAVFADELSGLSIERLQPVVREQWQSLLRELAPAMQKLLDEDEAEDRLRNQRLRVGMYAFAGPMTVVAGTPAAKHGRTAKKAATPRRRKE
jgi:hypothetical protein